MRVLITGSTGVVGDEVARALTVPGPKPELTRVARRPLAGEVAWTLGAEEPPEAVRGHWDVIVHTAASTRWSMTRDEAVAANIRPTEAVLDLAGPDTHLVHVSTAYADGSDPSEMLTPSEYGRYRNAYEWSKAECETLVRARHDGPLTVVRPPLILGARSNGAIARFSGPYTLMQTLVSGLAAAVIGDPDGYAELAPIDQVAEVIAAAVTGAPPAEPRTEVIAGGAACLTLHEMIEVLVTSLNEWRAERGISPIEAPPFIAPRRWHRFFLPFAKQHMSDVQLQVVELLSMFEAYTSMARPFEPTHQVADPGEMLARSVRWWADHRPRQAARIPEQWQLVAG